MFLNSNFLLFFPTVVLTTGDRMPNTLYFSNSVPNETFFLVTVIGKFILEFSSIQTLNNCVYLLFLLLLPNS